MLCIRLECFVLLSLRVNRERKRERGEKDEKSMLDVEVRME